MWWVDSASILLQCGQCKQSLPDQPTLTGNGGNTAGQSGIGLHSEPEVALAGVRENKGCCWILPRTQNLATICPYSASVSKMCKVLLYLHSQLNMILTWLRCWCCYIFSAWWLLAPFVPAYCPWETLSLQWLENKVFWKLFSAVIWWTSYGFFCKEGRRKGGKEERDNRRNKSQSLTEDCSRANNKHNKYSYQSRKASSWKRDLQSTRVSPVHQLMIHSCLQLVTDNCSVKSELVLDSIWTVTFNYMKSWARMLKWWILTWDINIRMKDHKRKNLISTPVHALLLRKWWTGSNYYLHCINSADKGWVSGLFVLVPFRCSKFTLILEF